MKVAFVSQDDYNEIWHTLHPQDRFLLGSGISGAVIHINDTLMLTDATVIPAEQLISEIRTAYAEIRRRKNLFKESEEADHADAKS